MKKNFFLKNNKGMGLVTVIVTVAIMSGISIIAMVFAYTTFQIKAAERKGAEFENRTTTVIDEIKASLQDVASEAVKKAYIKALPEYANKGDNIIGEFGTCYVNAVLNWTKDDESLFVKNAQNEYSLNTDVINSMIVDRQSFDNSGIVITAGDVVVYDTGYSSDVYNYYTVRVKDLTVKFDDGNNRTTSICDLLISCPDIINALTGTSITGVPEYCILNGGSVAIKASKSINVVGNIMCKGLKAETTSSSVTFDGGAVIVNGNVTSTGTGYGSTPHFTVGKNGTLWTNNITVGASSTVELLGKTYVANDLTISGNNASVKLGGSYYGFGYDGTDSSLSSSIISNAKNCTLNMEDLNELTLAGVSFVGVSTTAGDNIEMGESISAKPNQRVYLAPCDYVIDNSTGNSVGSNPQLLDSASVSVSLDTSTVLWTVPGKGVKTLGSYGASLKILTANSTVTSKKIVYYFLQFDTDAHRNDYFKDYFTLNENNINSYLKDYLEIVSNDDMISRTAGTLYSDTDGKTVQTATSEDLSTTCDAIDRMFTSLCYDLTTSNATVNNSPTPLKTTRSAKPCDRTYQKAFNLNKIKTVANNNEYVNTPVYFEDDSGEIVGIVYYSKSGEDVGKGTYTYKHTTADGVDLSNVRVLFVYGNVAINESFSGIIVCNGSVTIKANVESNASGVASAYNAQSTTTVGGSTVSLSQYFNSSVKLSTDATGGKNMWNVNTLVTTVNNR